ncbi:hypothetical protein SMICM304S_10936 [Streptomyces microflavus]
MPSTVSVIPRNAQPNVHLTPRDSVSALPGNQLLGNGCSLSVGRTCRFGAPDVP